MDPLVYTYFLYSWVIATNAIVIGLLWRSSRSSYYKVLFLVWLGGLALNIIVAVVGAAPPALQALLFVFAFPYDWCLALLLAMLAGIRFPTRPLLAVLGASVPASLALAWLGAPGWAVMLPVTVASGIPPLYVAGTAIFRRWGRLSITLRAFALILLCEGLHSFDYGFVFERPELLAIGFTVGFAFAIAFSILGPASVLEKTVEEKLRLELELEYKGKLAQAAKLASLGEMAGGMAHEINNPLGVASLNAELARRLIEVPEVDRDRIRRSLASVTAQLGRIAKVVSGLMSFAGESTSAPRQDARVGKIIEDTLALCAEKIRSRGVRLEVAAIPAPLSIRCQPAAISQALLNLMSNAMEAVEGSPDKWISIEAASTPEGCRVTVADSGPGVPTELRDKLFQPFFTTKRIGDGMGLGLSVSRGIVEAHGGSLRYEAEGGRTRFILLLPESANGEIVRATL